MIYGFNYAYEVEKRRSWWQLGITIGGLTLSLGLTTCTLCSSSSAELRWRLTSTPELPFSAAWNG
jgi:hypothetical protein